MSWMPFLLLVTITLVVSAFSKFGYKFALFISAIGLLLTPAVIGIDYSAQTHDVEVWSGRVVDWKHKDAWDEWVPPVTTCTSDDKGRQTCTTTPGYWIHHPAENYVKTSDDGWKRVRGSLDGKVKFNDKYPRTAEELKKYFPENMPTASTHSYVNKVNASYSIYKNEDVDLKEYPDLPEYPRKVNNYFFVDRILGKVPNKKVALERLAEHNSELNKMIPDPENEGKNRSYKQVNIIFVNVGENKDESYGFALQDS